MSNIPHMQHPPLCPLCNGEEGEPVTADFLATGTCGTPECPCEYIYLDPPPCHPRAGVEIEYCKKHNTLTLACRRCYLIMGSFLIAQDVQERQAA